ncbi:hypothetical protein Pcinc_018237 [Petrolisthes cinctipes]|uniref:Uncharacterized protein n=1 Tax=Petrolisthes cinctipes TaxID=88211 RepID=A0AAE1FP12_PETCI|nr:hypothetical protein Pcinc_018237 [Petrolisthes cinctipes]
MGPDNLPGRDAAVILPHAHPVTPHPCPSPVPRLLLLLHSQHHNTHIPQSSPARRTRAEEWPGQRRTGSLQPVSQSGHPGH